MSLKYDVIGHVINFIVIMLYDRTCRNLDVLSIQYVFATGGPGARRINTILDEISSYQDQVQNALLCDKAFKKVFRCNITVTSK